MEKPSFHRKILLSGLICLSILVLSLPAHATERVKDILSGLQPGDGSICGTVKAAIKEGMDAKDVVKTGIELGHNACLVVKCAIYGGGNLEKIITGAVQAGATSDVVARCAVDAGASAREVDMCLKHAGLSLCYFQPEGLGYTPPEDTVPFDPVPDPPRPISQSAF